MIFSSSNFRLFGLLALVILLISSAVEVPAASPTWNESAQRMYRELAEQDYSDSMTLIEIDLRDTLPYKTVVDQFLDGRQISALPVTGQERSTKQVLFGEGTPRTVLTTIEENGFFLAFISDGQCRTVTGRISTDQQTGWLIEKVWAARPGIPEDFDVGYAHNQALDFLLVDGNDKVVRKKPGRVGDSLALSPFQNTFPRHEDAFSETCFFLQTTYPDKNWSFPPIERLGAVLHGDPGDYEDYRLVRSKLKLSKKAQEYLDVLDAAFLESKSLVEFEVALKKLERRLEASGRPFQREGSLNDFEMNILREAIALTRGTVYFWGASGDWFDSDMQERYSDVTIADIHGFWDGTMFAISNDFNIQQTILFATAVSAYRSTMAILGLD